MRLERFFSDIEAPERTLAVINRSAPRPIQRMLEETFDGQAVEVDERSLPDSDEDVVLLLDSDGDAPEVVASSPLSALQDAVLLVNSDLYKTSTAGFDEYELPEVLSKLDEVPFRLRGYPESNKEKLLLIAISRHIERRAYRTGTGRLRSSFQRLSRLDDEQGTRAVYEQVADAGVQTHIYGVPDWSPPMEFPVRAHGGYAEEYRRSWFVVFTPENGDAAGHDDHGVTPSPATDCDAPGSRETDGSAGERGDDPTHAALLAIETAPRVWRGFWTFRPSLVADIDDYISTNL